jgi:hypothetical protein
VGSSSAVIPAEDFLRLCDDDDEDNGTCADGPGVALLVLRLAPAPPDAAVGTVDGPGEADAEVPRRIVAFDDERGALVDDDEAVTVLVVVRDRFRMPLVSSAEEDEEDAEETERRLDFLCRKKRKKEKRNRQFSLVKIQRTILETKIWHRSHTFFPPLTRTPSLSRSLFST